MENEKIYLYSLLTSLYKKRKCILYSHDGSTVGNSMTLEAAKTLAHAFISSRLDYCDSLLFGIGVSMLAKLQTVQNAAARVITGTRKFDHITPVF